VAEFGVFFLPSAPVPLWMKVRVIMPVDRFFRAESSIFFFLSRSYRQRPSHSKPLGDEVLSMESVGRLPGDRNTAFSSRYVSPRRFPARPLRTARSCFDHFRHSVIAHPLRLGVCSFSPLEQKIFLRHFETSQTAFFPPFPSHPPILFSSSSCLRVLCDSPSGLEDIA